MIEMDLVNIDGKQTEFLTIYNSSDENIVIYISSSDRRDYTDDLKAIIDDKKETGVTLSDVIEGLDIGVLIGKDEAIKEIKALVNQIEGWKNDGARNAIQ